MATEIFPQCPQLGYSSKPRHSVGIVTLPQFRERRNAKSAEAYRVFSFRAEHENPDIAAVLEFANAHGGPLHGFRFKDWLDYQSCRLGSVPTALDQPLVQIDSTHFQLVKNYTYGALTRSRTIVKPVAAELLIANNSNTPIASSGNWSIDPETGILTKLGGFTGTPAKWGGAFYCYVRFEDDPEYTLTFDTVQDVVFNLLEIPLE